jgi:DNA-binding NarL/FixJ family response regulator
MPGADNGTGFRLALLHGDDYEAASFAGLLERHGVAPVAGILPLTCESELGPGALDAVVVAADPGESAAISAVRSIRRRIADVGIVVVGPSDGAFRGRAAINAGADAFIADADAARALVPAVHAVLAGLVCVPRRQRRLVAKPTFSHREKEVMELLVIGFTNRQIAERLHLAESTVKSHVASAFAKLGVRSRKDAAAIVLDPAEELGATLLPHAVAPGDVASPALAPAGPAAARPHKLSQAAAA